MNIGIKIGINDSQNPLYGHLIITDGLLCPWERISYIFSNFNTLNAETFDSSLGVRIYLKGFDCTYLLQVQGNGMNERHLVTSSELLVGTSESNRASEQLSATVTGSQVGENCEQRSAGRIFALTSFHPEANDLTRVVTSNQESSAVKTIEDHSVIKGIRDSQALTTGYINPANSEGDNQVVMETSKRTGAVMDGSIQEINQETRAVMESETFRRNQFETGVCHQNSNSENYLQPVDSENLQVRAQTSRFTCDRKAHTFQSGPRPKPRLKIMGKSVTESFQHKDSSLPLPPLNTRCTDTRTRMAEGSNCTSPRTMSFRGTTGYQNDQCLKSFYQNTVGKTGSTLKPHSKVESPYTPVLSNTNWEVSCNHLTLFERIGGGSFGQVWKGAAWEVNGTKSWSVVAVKMLKGEVRPPSLANLHILEDRLVPAGYRWDSQKKKNRKTKQIPGLVQLKLDTSNWKLQYSKLRR